MLSFKVPISSLIKKLKLRAGFYFRNKYNFTFSEKKKKKKRVEATVLPVIDYGDALYRPAATSTLSSLYSVYHASLRVISDAKPLTDHCKCLIIDNVS